MPHITKTPAGGTITRYDAGEVFYGDTEESIDFPGHVPEAVSRYRGLHSSRDSGVVVRLTVFIFDEVAFNEMVRNNDRMTKELDALKNARRDEMFAAARSLIASGEHHYSPTAAQVQQPDASVTESSGDRFSLIEVDDELVETPKPKRKRVAKPRTRKAATP